MNNVILQGMRHIGPALSAVLISWLAMTSIAYGSLEELSAGHDINVSNGNETSYIVVMPPAENLSTALHSGSPPPISCNLNLGTDCSGGCPTKLGCPNCPASCPYISDCCTLSFKEIKCCGKQHVCCAVGKGAYSVWDSTYNCYNLVCYS